MSSVYIYDHFSLTDVGNHRQNNEDSYGGTTLSDGRLFIVCDGMGAHQAGEHASSLCVKLIKEYFTNNGTGNSSIDLYNAINFANEQLYIAASNNPEYKGMGTTVVALVIRNSEIFIGHVGDSRIYLLSSGNLIQLTKDHSFVQGLVDQGIITRREMETHSRKNELTNAIGIFPQIQPSISKTSIQVKAGDKFLLCTDGLNGMISDEDIQAELSASKGLDEICNGLVTKAKIAGGNDNITVSVINIIKSPFNKTLHDGLNVGRSGKSEPRKKKFYNHIAFQLAVVGVFLIGVYFSFKVVSEFVTNRVEQDSQIANDDSSIENSDETNKEISKRDEEKKLESKKNSQDKRPNSLRKSNTPTTSGGTSKPRTPTTSGGTSKPRTPTTSGGTSKPRTPTTSGGTSKPRTPTTSGGTSKPRTPTTSGGTSSIISPTQ